MPYLSVSLIIRHNLNIHPVHSPASFLLVQTIKQTGGKLPPLNQTLRRKLPPSCRPSSNQKVRFQSWTSCRAGNCLLLMIRPAVLLWVPWQPGPWSNYWPSKVSAGHPWCIAVIKVVYRKENIQMGHSNVIRGPMQSLSSIGCWELVTK